MISIDGFDTVSVIASGWSLGDLNDLERDRIPGFRLGVNDNCWRLRCDAGLSMDRLWIENRWPQILYVAKPLWARIGTDRNITKPLPDWVYLFGCHHESWVPSSDWGHLNGTSSGMCAVNLALQLAPKRILMWGFDMCRAKDGRAYWHKPYWWAKPQGGTGAGRYDEWSRQFHTIERYAASKGIELLNCSPPSKITSIRKIDPRSVLS